MLRPPLLSTPHRRRLVGLIALLGLVTAVATYLQGALSVLSTYLIDEFSISRSQLGLAFTAFSLVGGIAAPIAGRLADLSTRRVMAALFGVSIVAIVLAATAPAYPIVLAATLIGGSALAAGNPVTNKVVSDEFTPARRGLAMGLKQAGPPLGLLAAGVVLPPLAAVVGWRWALASTALIPLAGLALTPSMMSGEHPRPAASGPGAGASPAAGRATVWWLSAIGFGVAAGIAGTIAFVPLFAHEALGFSESVAGLLAAVIGLAGVVGRVAWGMGASRFRHPTKPLALIAVLSLVSSLMIWGAEALPALIWIAAVAAGLTMLPWHTVAWLALLADVDVREVGRSTGIVQAGNSAGFASGPPIVGLLVDTTGSYAWAWGTIAAIFAAISAATLVWHRRLR